MRSLKNARQQKCFSPVILVNKLDRNVGISTVTGDFYSLSEDAFTALKTWQKSLADLGAQNQAVADRLGRDLNIPSNVLRCFPLKKGMHSTRCDRDASIGVTDLTLNLTSRCNLKCVYCWNDRGGYSNTMFNGEGATHNAHDLAMGLDIAKSAVDLLIQLSGGETDLVVDFYGGEPLMNMGTLLDVVKYCRQQEEVSGKRFHYLLATNATLLTPQVARTLIDAGVQIAVSVDGPAEVQDHNRPLLDGNGSFAVIEQNLALMPARMRERLVGRATVTPFYPDMVGLYWSLRKLGFERIEIFESEDACHTISPQRESVFFKSKSQREILFREYERLALLYVDEAIKGNLDYRKTFFNRFFKLMQRLYYHHEVSGGCPAAKGQLAVMADGGIYPCTAFLGIQGFKVGNVQGGLDIDSYNRFLSAIGRRFDLCADCDLYSLCRTTGSCLNMNHYFNGDVAKPYESSCDVFRERLSLAVACLDILKHEIPDRLDALFGFDPVGRRGNQLY